jgi:hypothetical protein
MPVAINREDRWMDTWSEMAAGVAVLPGGRRVRGRALRFRVITEINNRPRKILHQPTPTEVLQRRYPQKLTATYRTPD